MRPRPLRIGLKMRTPSAKDWVEDAHTFEKEEFFRLFTVDMRQRLVEEER